MMENEPPVFSQSPYQRPISLPSLSLIQVFFVAIFSAILGSVFTLSFLGIFSKEKKSLAPAIAAVKSSSSLTLDSFPSPIISSRTFPTSPQQSVSRKPLTTAVSNHDRVAIKQNSFVPQNHPQSWLNSLKFAESVEGELLAPTKTKSARANSSSVKYFPTFPAKSRKSDLQIAKKFTAIQAPISTAYFLAQNQHQVKPETDIESTLTNEREEVKLSLNDVVFLVVENNRNIKNAYLDRIIARQNLAVAEDKFVPNFTPRVSLSVEENESRSLTTNNREFNLGTDFAVKIPTGADIQLEWNALRRSTAENRIDLLESIAQNRINQTLELSFTQPLLKDFGININRASIEIARIEEQVDFLQLKNTLIETITSAIQTYRSLVQAQEQVKIQQLSLERAKRQLEITQALIEAGRLARIELVQNQTDIASREVSLLNAQRNLANARLNLLQILDIEGDLQIIAAEISETVGENVNLDYKQLWQQALANDPEYLQAIYAVEIEKLNVLLAENNQRWDLDLQLSYGIDADNLAENNTDLRAGLSFTREFGNLELEQAVERSKIDLEKSENNLREIRENLGIDLQDRIRDVEISLRQVELARRFRELAEERLENEREKLRLGVPGTRLIDIINFENDLVEARNAELNAKIDYLNALTSLQQTVGITLEVWEIELEEN
ncbi:MAG: TolC family protein [Kamptonema sp. SIO1D9]|nr:TolC family protein [Kamptonema sp. SIO1D9]